MLESTRDAAERDGVHHTVIRAPDHDEIGLGLVRDASELMGGVTWSM